MNWCFAIINGKLAEVFFEMKGNKIKFLGHACVKESEYSTKKELEWIKKDTGKFKFVYKLGKYKDKSTNKIYLQEKI